MSVVPVMALVETKLLPVVLPDADNCTPDKAPVAETVAPDRVPVDVILSPDILSVVDIDDNVVVLLNTTGELIKLLP